MAMMLSIWSGGNEGQHGETKRAAKTWQPKPSSKKLKLKIRRNQIHMFCTSRKRRDSAENKQSGRGMDVHSGQSLTATHSASKHMLSRSFRHTTSDGFSYHCTARVIHPHLDTYAYLRLHTIETEQSQNASRTSETGHWYHEHRIIIVKGWTMSR